MNTKKNKHKPKNKPQNPQPRVESDIQNEEIKEDKTDTEDKPVVTKSEEKIPVVSEIVSPVLDAKVSEGDTPKKPKRNRGKKKKSDKDEDLDVSQEEKQPELMIEEIKFSVNDEEVKTTAIVEEKSTDSVEITPAARKKKNKNKKQSEPAEKTEEELKLAPIRKEDLADVKIVTLIPVTAESEDAKSKKKNKKKKRTDSDRSDVVEEVVSCTAAFQKLLEGSEKKELKSDTKLEESKLTSEKITVSQDAVVEPLVKTEMEIIVEQDVIKSDTSGKELIPEAKEDQKECSGKSKKKNKKDKKHPTKNESDEDVQKQTERMVETLTEEKIIAPPMDFATSTATEIKEEFGKMKDTTENIGVEKPFIEKEKSPKPKAKIAKPVDKKNKGKTESLSTENLLEIGSIQTDEKNIVTSETVKREAITEQKKEITPVDVDEMKTKEPRIPTDTIEKKIPETIPEVKEEPFSLPESKEKRIPESETGKKGKKSKQNLEFKAMPASKVKSIDTETGDNATKRDLPGSALKNLEEPLETITEKNKTKPTAELTKEPLKENAPIPLGFEPIQPIEVNILATPEILKTPGATFKEFEIHKSGLPVPESGTSKKRKKSPKPQPAEKPLQSAPNISEESIITAQATKTVESDNKQPDTKTESPTKSSRDDKEERKDDIDLPQLEDIEIRSIKTDESEGSACDIVPDVRYPRASSQLLDDNNNTVIRDITAADVKLNIPFVTPDTPFIQGSGETPLTTPELIPLGIRICEVEPSTNLRQDIASKSSDHIYTIKADEKTDLKSKVLDVNQGMEELRKSIERSLAELSAIEKNEKNAEDQFAKAQSKLEEIQELASKKSSDRKEIAEKNQEAKPSEVKTTDIGKLETQINPVLKRKEIKQKDATQEQNSATKKEEFKLQEPMTASKIVDEKSDGKSIELSSTEIPIPPPPPPLPTRKDNKGKGKKKKGNKDPEQSTTLATATSSTSTESSSNTTAETKESKDTNKDDKNKQKTDTQEKGKQQSDAIGEENVTNKDSENTDESKAIDSVPMEFEPIESFEDAMTSSADDVNKSFEIIANEANQCDQTQNPEINITEPAEDHDKGDPKDDKVNPVSQPKNLLGHPDIPARLNKTDYKKEKDKTPNNRQARVRIKDSVPVDISKQSKESQTENKRRFLKDKTVTESISSVVNENEEYIYKYSFRKVFLPSACHVCKKDLKQYRVPCSFCSLVFYCGSKHKDEDYPQHQALCFAVSTVGHLKEQKHIYADAKNITGQDYRLLRMQMIVSCEKVLKRRLSPWEQEALLYPRVCADVQCREWRQAKLKDCEGCGQIAYCADHPDHLPVSHQRWCKSYSLYHRLVVYQQTKGRLEPKLPSRVMAELYQIPEKLNEVLASMYEEKIDMTDIQYAALTQIATAPLTAAYCQQLYTSKMNTIYANGTVKKSSFTIHVVGAELQFEADALNKWEVFFLHLRPDVKDLRVVLVGPDLNPSNLPLDLLGKIKLCENCRLNKRRVVFEFQDNKSYYEYWSSDFSSPDLVCAFNPSIQRSSIFNGKDTWPSTIKCIMKLRTPFIVTSYTMSELSRDLARIKQCAETDLNIIAEPKCNAFASVRPDRNFISDDEMPLLFKNFCFSVVCGSI